MKVPEPLAGLDKPTAEMFIQVARRAATPSDHLRNTKWRVGALCQDTNPELFFPVGATGLAITQIEQARQVCNACPCQEPCLEFALRTNQDAGVWGGSSEEERRHLRRTYLGRHRSVSTDL